MILVAEPFGQEALREVRLVRSARIRGDATTGQAVLSAGQVRERQIGQVNLGAATSQRKVDGQPGEDVEPAAGPRQKDIVDAVEAVEECDRVDVHEAET